MLELVYANLHIFLYFKQNDTKKELYNIKSTFIYPQIQQFLKRFQK